MRGAKRRGNPDATNTSGAYIKLDCFAPLAMTTGLANREQYHFVKYYRKNTQNEFTKRITGGTIAIVIANQGVPAIHNGLPVLPVPKG
ncbi:MAG: hypothetical protein FWH55_10090 [Oscillospiraceae bacterium]|nr:hypothetical protein [Oscillospiraceae bacterium]